MKRRRDMAGGVDDDGLQADVMRFMAIIAFCLVAIMALARNAAPLGADTAAIDAHAPAAEAPVAWTPNPAAAIAREVVGVEPVAPRPAAPEPAAPEHTAPEPVSFPLDATRLESPPTEPVLAGVSVPTEAPAVGTVPSVEVPLPEVPLSEVPLSEVSLPEALPAEPTPTPARPQKPSLPTDPRARYDAIVAALEVTAAPVPVVDDVQAEPVIAEAPTEAAPDVDAQSSSEPPEEEGLSLRFASERDFLRLVGRDAIEVFAFREGDVLALTSNLRFAETAAPGQVYELLPGTIPSEISRLLADVRPDTARFQWGVRMPGRIERAVRAQVDAGAAGVLVIDRFGEVRLLAHEEASR